MTDCRATDIEHREHIFRLFDRRIPSWRYITFMTAKSDRSTIANGKGEPESNKLSKIDQLLAIKLWQSLRTQARIMK